MQIWLGEQLLGPRDVQSLEANGGSTGTTIQLVISQSGQKEIEGRPVLDITSLVEDCSDRSLRPLTR